MCWRHRPRSPEWPARHLPRGDRTFRWTAEASQALAIAADQPTEIIPDDIRTMAGQLIVSAFVAGTRVEQLVAVDLLPVAPAEVGAWVVRRVHHSGRAVSGELLDHVTRAAARAPETFAALSPRNRITLVAEADAALVNRVGARGVSSWAGARTMEDTLRTLLAVAHVTAWAGLSIGVLLLVPLFTAPADWPDRSSYLISLVFALVLFACVVTRVVRPAMALIMLVPVALIAAATGALRLIHIPHLLFTDAGALLGHIVLIAVLTWPVSAAAQVVILGEAPQGWDRVLPQRRLVLHAAPRVASRVRGRLPRIRDRVTPAGIWDRFGGLLVAMAVVGALYVIAVADLPDVADRPGSARRGWICVAFLAVVILTNQVRKTLKAAADRRRFAALLRQGEVTRKELLGRLDGMSTAEGTARFVRDLAVVPRDLLRPAAEVLSDLVGALDHVARLVPPGTTPRIPAALWDYAPRFHDSAFPAWLVEYDRKHPGRLSWLAARHHDALALAARNAAGRADESQPPARAGSPPAAPERKAAIP